MQRRYPIGLELDGGDAHARVWAPRCRRVELVLAPAAGNSADGDEDGRSFALERECGDYFSGVIPGVAAGQRYGFRLHNGARVLPDPASRFQPEGPDGPSQIVDRTNYAWSDASWPGIGAKGQVVYELHIGTFTREGTFRAACAELPRLAELGVTVLELMPVAEFAGRFGWGYDGVNLWAPTHLYGTPDDLRALVDSAHCLGLGVILDVVYNHVGCAGNTLQEFALGYFSKRHENEWGHALNFDGPRAAAVREFAAENAAYWVDEFHMDGLRFDATQAIHDDSAEHVLRAIARRAREAARGRSIWLVAENEAQNARLIEPCESGGFGLDALWNDDFHHAARVALTGRREAYYSDYTGRPQELVSAVRWGFLYQGQGSAWQGHPRGTPVLDLPAHRFVAFLENHDQTANSASGARLHQLSSAGRLRALTALLLLGPATPMLFQGQEFGTARPFLYFADPPAELRAGVRAGRAEFLRQFPSLCTAQAREQLADPGQLQTFRCCQLDAKREAEQNPHFVALHRDLLQLRRTDPAFAEQRSECIAGAVFGEAALLLRYRLGGETDRLLVVNLGADLSLAPAPEPLLAPPRGGRWEVLWSSEDPRYGGLGVRPLEAGRWQISAESALVLRPTRDGCANAMKRDEA